VSPDHPEASPNFSSSLTKILVYESVVEGGFGKNLKLEDGALLELGRFEHSVSADSSDAPPGAPDAVPEAEASGTSSLAPDRRRRFSSFHFRKRDERRAAGPALAVVDVEPSAEEESKDKEEDIGVRITIRLAALDEQSTELTSPNEQVTYLHVVRFGVPGERDAGDVRPWVVKVVKREATVSVHLSTFLLEPKTTQIGPHTFQLHEIYGLTSHTSGSAAPTAPLPSTHTYPPADTIAEAPAGGEEDEALSECLVCLSSPREVVLLPCRHLVACKDCALNMVEFGAGGNIVQNEEPVEAGGDAAANGADVDANASTAATAGADAPVPITAVPSAPTPRRKRKAKGWFCPVCRQREFLVLVPIPLMLILQQRILLFSGSQQILHPLRQRKSNHQIL
jgi:hypothetical protein